MDLKTQLEVQGATQQWVASFMNQTHTDSMTMISALNNVIVQLQNQVVTDLLIDIQKEKNEQFQEVIEDDSSS